MLKMNEENKQEHDLSHFFIQFIFLDSKLAGRKEFLNILTSRYLVMNHLPSSN